MRFNGLVLALDLATVTGWALGTPDWVLGTPGATPTFGHMRLMETGGNRAHAYRKLRDWLEELCDKSIPSLIVYESPAVPSIMSGQTNIKTTRLLVGLAEHVEEWAYDYIELREAMASQVRAHFLGRNMKAEIAKPLTIERCRRMGWDVQTSDEADACALWHYQCVHLRPDLAAKSAHRVNMSSR